MRVKNRKKEAALAAIILIVIILSLGYGYLNTTLGIEGNSIISSNKWDIHFDNVKILDGSVIATKPATINKDLDTINFAVTFNNLGDYYDFTFNVVNGGTIDARLSELIKLGVSDEQEKYVNFNVTYANGEQINVDDKLAAGTSRNIRIRVDYKADIFEGEINAPDKVLDLSFRMNYVQDRQKV